MHRSQHTPSLVSLAFALAIAIPSADARAQSGRPAFGGFTPGAGATGGFTFGGGSINGRLGFGFSQGYSRSISSFSPSVTTMNGARGFVQSGVQRPFVTGLVPAVGAQQILVPLPGGNPLVARYRNGERPTSNPSPRRNDKVTHDSTPPQGASPAPFALVDPVPPTKAEREQRRAAEESARTAAILKYIDKGRKAQRGGKPSVARLYYQMAARRAEGELKERALSLLREVNR